MAVEHAILIAIWNMLNTGAFYSDPGGGFYTTQPGQDQAAGPGQLRQMGYEVKLSALPAAS